MVQGVQDIAAMLVGVVGLIGVAATTGMPMWKVTAFIGENIIVMETRWEGLWMNCYRQANIRMQCKVYDSLLFLPPDLQAARGLMCCSLALSAVGLLVALAGMRCISCIRGNERAKVIILMAGGGMQFAACVCVFIPVSWTGHVIIRDFYNPLLIDAQRRELGEALYIGWVTGAFLFASGVLFTCRRLPEDKGAYPSAGYPHQGNGLGYRAVVNPLMGYHPISSASSLAAGPLPPIAGRGPAMQPTALQDNRITPFHPNGLFYPVESGRQPMFPPASTGHSSPSFLPSPETSLYTSHPSTLYTMQPLARHHPSTSSSYTQYSLKPVMPQHNQPSTSSYTGSSFHPVPQNPLFIRYHKSRLEPDSYSGTDRGGVYI